ncbi:uncharacterized protein LOC135394782 isoform X4 [Ornithodoros turicata]|uniref:uncharacterized protein LOC135394782 isoform X4 n=1 Tax=Ornithodoros turicata TaxID=34597 RepID=UPI003139E6EB
MAEALRRGWADSRVYTVAVQVTTVRQVLVVQQDTGNCCEVWKSNWRRFLVVSLVAFVILIPMITVGSLYIYECPAHWIIPIFLVASGSSALLLLLFIWCFPGVTHPCFMALFSFILYLFLGTNIASTGLEALCLRCPSLRTPIFIESYSSYSSRASTN